MTAEQVVAALKKSARWHHDFGGELARQSYERAAALVREHLIETDEQRRERFEAWCVYEGLYKQKFPDGHYISEVVQTAWDSWQAALTWRGETKGGET